MSISVGSSINIFEIDDKELPDKNQNWNDWTKNKKFRIEYSQVR